MYNWLLGLLYRYVGFVFRRSGREKSKPQEGRTVPRRKVLVVTASVSGISNRGDQRAL